MNWKTFTKDFKRTLAKALDDVTKASNLKKYAEDLAKGVQKRTRLGKSVDKHEAAPKRMKKLAASTVKQRKRKKSTLSGYTSPAKSNLSETGVMLDSVKGKAKKKEIEISVSNKEEAKAGYAKKDRPFMNLDKAQVKKLKEELTDELEKAIIKGLT